jgi:cytochrome b subunit of formate dehydrogenase
MNKNLTLLKRFVHWLLLAVTIIYVLTGLGITQYRIIESITFGVLTKNLSFNIHDNLLIPFIILLISHVILTLIDHRVHQNNPSLPC